MYWKINLGLLSILLLLACVSRQAAPSTIQPEYAVQLDSTVLFDQSRNRPIPLAFYTPKNHKSRRLVIVNHGYGQNRGGDYLAYSYLTNYLASKGCFVVSIQHELPGDSLLPMTGIPQIVRRSNWERGVVNITVVISELKKLHPELDFKHLTLIGHSNGGDMCMLLAQKHPELADKVISLDNRRVALPRTSRPKIYSLRSSDQPADEGVLPSLEEQQRFGIKIIKLPNTIHNDMDDSGTALQHAEINAYIWSFLND